MGQPHLGKNGTAMSSLLHHNGLYMDILVSTLSDLKKKKMFVALEHAVLSYTVYVGQVITVQPLGLQSSMCPTFPISKPIRHVS